MTEYAYQLMDTANQEASIKVIGIGGGGGNAVSHMVTKGIKGVEFICANTDTQDLRMTQADIQLQIGINETKGLGSGSKPEIGRASAEEDKERIASVIDGSNMLFIAAGLGGGTGTGACGICWWPPSDRTATPRAVGIHGVPGAVTVAASIRRH